MQRFKQLERWQCHDCKTERGWGYYHGVYRNGSAQHHAMLNCNTCRRVTRHVYLPHEPVTIEAKIHRSVYGHPNLRGDGFEGKDFDAAKVEELFRIQQRVRMKA